MRQSQHETNLKPGDAVIERDEVLVDIETDKVVLEVPAPEAGVLEAIIEEEGARSQPFFLSNLLLSSSWCRCWRANTR